MPRRRPLSRWRPRARPARRPMSSRSTPTATRTVRRRRSPRRACRRTSTPKRSRSRLPSRPIRRSCRCSRRARRGCSRPNPDARPPIRPRRWRRRRSSSSPRRRSRRRSTCRSPRRTPWRARPSPRGRKSLPSRSPTRKSPSPRRSITRRIQASRSRARYAAESQPGDSGPEPDTAQHAAEPEIAYAAEQEPAPAPPEHEPSAPEPDRAAPAEPAPVLDSADVEPSLGHETAGVQARPGYPIPGLPEPEGAEPPAGLPEPPRRVRAAQPAPMRRAFRRVEDGSAGAGLTGEGGGGRERRSRWIAILALLAIGIVVAVLVYSLKHSSSSHPTAKAPAVVKVLIPEGKTRLQIAQIASAAGLTGSYRLAARSSPLLNPAQYGAPKATQTLEGFLFPATYDMDKGAPSQRLVEEQVTAFQENFSAEYAKRAKELGLTPYELLTVASMIEREAQVPSDRAKIAAVIYNRLKAGIPIGIDAAIYYAVENADNIPTYTKELTASQLQIELGLQHAPPQRAAADADLEPRRGLDPGGGAPGARAPTCTTSPAPTAAASRSSRPRKRSSMKTSRLTKPPSAPTAVTCRPASITDAEARRPRVAGRPQPLARDPQRRARRARVERLALPAPARPAAALRRDDARARRGGVRRRERHDPPQGGRARPRRRGERESAS